MLAATLALACVEFPEEPASPSQWYDDVELEPREAGEPNWDVIGTEQLINGATFERFMAFVGHRCVTLTYDYSVMSTELSYLEVGELLGCSSDASPPNERACAVHRLRFGEVVWLANAMSREAGLTECYNLSRCSVEFRPEVLRGAGCGDGAFRSEGPSDRECEDSPYIVDPTRCDGYRVPTASEWIYAGFGGERMQSSCDWAAVEAGAVCPDDFVVDEATLGPCESTSDYVGSRLPNLFGLYDMMGNVPEMAASDRGWNQEIRDEENMIGCLVDPAPSFWSSGPVPAFGGGLLLESASIYAEWVPESTISMVVNGNPRYEDNEFYAGVRFVRTMPEFVVSDE